MKKLALVLGSLLVVGTAASAKEVVPAPVVVPEKVVEIVEKPVIVYRDREVAPAWRPNGSVNIETRNWTKIENHDSNDKNWKGDDEWTQLRTTTSINFTEKQNLTIHTRNKFGIDDENHETSSFQRIDLTHKYNFGKLGTSKVNATLRNMFTHRPGGKWVETGVVFDFSEYLFQNDYVKTSAFEIAPYYRYDWTHGGHYTNNAGFYANAEFELPYGVTFQAEFDDLFNYARVNNDKGSTLKYKTGSVELTLGKAFDLYKNNAHTLKFGTNLVYATDWAYNKKSVNYDNGLHGLNVEKAGTERTNGSKEKWGSYTAKLDPHFIYSYAATDFVKVYARVGAEYMNRETNRHAAKYWRWQPYARVGATVSF